MKRRQTMPGKWLIADAHSRDRLWQQIRRLPRGSGILLLTDLRQEERRRLRHLARLRGLVMIDQESGAVARVHNVRELRAALLARRPLILLSPLYPTRSHSEWTPLPLMRAAALARLGGRRLVALGGMNQRRYAKVAALGFIGWAGIDSFRT